jgi:hypothetical protein
MPSADNRQSLIFSAIIVACAFALTALYVITGNGAFPLDDSWIHQTYARNLAESGTWSFVPGVPSAASTSPLYTVVLATGYALGVNFTLWTHGLGALALAVTGVIAQHIGTRTLLILRPAAQKSSRTIGFAAGLAIVTAWHLLWATASGMETMIFSMLTLVMIGLSLRELHESRAPAFPRVVGRGAIFGVCAGVTVLARPEGALLVAMCGLALLIARPHGFLRVVAFGTAAIMLSLIVLSPYIAFNIAQTGGLLPDTAAAKQAYAAPILALGYFWRVQQMTIPLLAGAQILLIPGMIVYLFALFGVRPRAFAAVYGLLPAWGVALILLYAAWLPLPFQHGRYVIPALPALIVCGVVGTAIMLHAAKASLVTRVLSRTLALSVAVLSLGIAFTLGLQAYRTDVRVIEEEMVAPAQWIAQNLNPAQTLAIHDIGAVGYFAPRPIIDIAGLVSPEFVALIDDPDAMWALMQEQGAQFLMALPDQVPGDRTDDPRLCPVFQSDGVMTFQAGGEKMTVYALAWDGVC